MVNVAPMRGWLKKHFTSPIVGHIADWATLLGIVAAFISWTGLMAWAASSIGVIAEQGWGAVFFAAIGITFILALMARALLPILVYFRPPPPATAPPRPAPSNAANDYSGQIRHIESFLLDIIHIERMRMSDAVVEKLIKRSPTVLKINEISNFDEDFMSKQLAEFTVYCEAVESDVYVIGFGNQYTALIRQSEAQAEAELTDTKIPNDLPPFDFRKWFIARANVRYTITFLQNRKVEYEKSTLHLIHHIDEKAREIRNRQG